METQERGQASPEAELSFRSEQLRVTVSLRKWRPCAVAPGAAGFVGLEEEGAYQDGRPLDNFLPWFCLCSLGWELSVLGIILELGGGGGASMQAFARLRYF